MVISMSNVYVLNENGVFFTVANNVHVVKDVLIEGGCTLHNSINELYDAVIEKNGIDRDEIDGAELQIILKDGLIVAGAHQHSAHENKIADRDEEEILG